MLHGKAALRYYPEAFSESFRADNVKKKGGSVMMFGKVYRMAEAYRPMDGLTVSTKECVSKSVPVTCFSLGKGTDISPETYPTLHLYLIHEGSGCFLLGNDRKKLPVREGDMLVTAGGMLCGAATENGLIYTEIIPGKDVHMNQIIEAGEVFRLADKLPYKEGSIVNLDVASNDSMKYVLMAFDEGTGLSPHSAPGDAIVFALEGKAVIGYEGEDHPISAGEQFRFARGGLHSVTADGRFKMALLLILK